EPILVNSNRKERIQTALNELKPSDFGTSLHATLQSVRNLLESAEIRNRDRRIYIFTDLQKGGWVIRDENEARKFGELLKALGKKENTRFFLYDAGTNDAFNHAIVDLRANDRVITTKRTTRFTASIHNFSSIPRPSVNVGFYVNDNLVKTEPTVLPPGATTQVNFEYDFAEAAPHVVRVSIDPDYLDVDDSRWLAVDVKSALRALVIDGEPKDNPKESETYAFTLALDPTRQGDI